MKGATSLGTYLYVSALGAAAALIFVGDRANLPRLQALGAAILGLGLVAVGVESIRTRYFEVGPDPGSLRSSSRFVFRGPGALSWGLMCLALGSGAALAAAIVLLGLQDVAGRLIAERPGIVLAPLGLLFLCTAGGWLFGEERMNSSSLLFLATLPHRLGAVITVLFSLAVLAVGLFELAAPAAFDHIVESLKPPPHPPVPR